MKEGPHRLGPAVKGAAQGGARPGMMGDVGITGGVDEHPPPHCLPARLGLDDDGVDGLAILGHAHDHAVQEQGNARLLAHLVDDDLECLGIKADAPLLDGLLPTGGAPQGVHALGDLAQDSFYDGSMCLGGGVRQHGRYQAGGGQPAHEAVSLDKQGVRTVPRRGHRGRESPRPAATHHHVRLVHHRGLPCGLADRLHVSPS